MSILVGITQRIVKHDAYEEYRDALSQDWAPFLQQADITYIPLPNTPKATQRLLVELPFTGFILSGGNTIGQAPKRDEVETTLLDHSIDKDLPVIGVCRGMQMMHHYLGGALENINGHVKTRHQLLFQGQTIEVNSFHDQGIKKPVEDLNIMAQNEDGVIEAFKHE